MTLYNIIMSSTLWLKNQLLNILKTSRILFIFFWIFALYFSFSTNSILLCVYTFPISISSSILTCSTFAFNIGILRFWNTITSSSFTTSYSTPHPPYISIFLSRNKKNDKMYHHFFYFSFYLTWRIFVGYSLHQFIVFLNERINQNRNIVVNFFILE